MKNKLLQFNVTLLFVMVGITAKSQTSWSITGNSNTTNANFIGTKNGQPLIFKTGNVERMRNPFNQSTVIKYYLPGNTRSAVINISDMNGRFIKTIPVTARGNGQLTLEGGQLTTGIYQYSLVINGKLFDTKRMVLTK